MRILLDADDDWIEGFRRFWYPRLHPYLTPFGGYGLGHVGDTQYVGHLPESEEVIEEELVALGFLRNPVACLKSLADGRVSEGSWALRLDGGKQLHVTLFERADGQTGREMYAHNEYDWRSHPVKHLREVALDAETGVSQARSLVDTTSFLTLTVR